MVHTEIFPNWGCHWSQDQVGAHHRHNTTPVVTGWSRVSYLGNFVHHPAWALHIFSVDASPSHPSPNTVAFVVVRLSL